MTTPGVGVLMSLTFVSAIDETERFRSSRMVGAQFGLTPKKYQSGETDHSGRISKIGDAGVRTALYEAAQVILTRPVKGSDLKTWALGVARRAGMRKTTVALARRIEASEWGTIAGSRRSGIIPAIRSTMPIRRSARASKATPPSEVMRPPSKAALTFLRSRLED